MIGIVDDPEINAANAAGGQFFVTTGRLQKADDDRLRVVLAHQDLNHVAKAQVLGVGLNIGAAILDQVFSDSGAITPLARELVARAYSRDEEYAADRHGVELPGRVGYPKGMMITTAGPLTLESRIQTLGLQRPRCVPPPPPTHRSRSDISGVSRRGLPRGSTAASHSTTRFDRAKSASRHLPGRLDLLLHIHLKEMCPGRRERG